MQTSERDKFSGERNVLTLDFVAAVYESHAPLKHGVHFPEIPDVCQPHMDSIERDHSFGRIQSVVCADLSQLLCLPYLCK